jgi:hypothetical protein
MLKFFIIVNFFFLYVPIKSSIFGAKEINKVIEYSSLWNWIPQAHQADFFNMKRKNSIQNSLLHYGIFLTPFIFTGYQIKKRINSIYKNNSSIFQLFFNYRKDKQKTNIDNILIDFFKDEKRKNFFCSKIIECIDEALKEENKYDNYVNYYKTYLRKFFSKIYQKFQGFLHLTNKKYFLEMILFHFTWKLIRLKDRYNLNELEKKLLAVEAQENGLPNKEEEAKLKEGLESIYAVIQEITKYPYIDFLAQNEPNPQTIKKQVQVNSKEQKENPQKIEKITEFIKIKDALQKLLSINSINSNTKKIHQLHNIEKNHKLEILFNKLSIQESNKDDSALTFIKQEIPKIISLPSISEFQLSPWISNIFTLSLLTLNTYPWFYFSDLKNTFNPYQKYKFKNM